MNTVCRYAATQSRNLYLRDFICPKFLPSRNTHILKRKFTAPLTRVLAKRPRLLKPKYFIYEELENTNLTEPPDLHVVLTTFVEGIGDVGDVISLIPHYAREHLLLPKKAEYATPENIEKYSRLKQTRPERPMFSSIYAGMTIRRLSKTVIPVMLNSEESWTIGEKHVQIAFRMEGFVVPEDAIEVPDNPITGPDPIKEGKDFAVFITINNREKFPVRCRIFHIRADTEKLKCLEERYLERKEPILKQQEELLNNMPVPEISDDDPTKNISLREKYRITYIK